MKTFLLILLTSLSTSAAWWDDVASERAAKVATNGKHVIRIKSGTTLRNHRFRMPCLVIMETGSSMIDCTFNRPSSITVKGHNTINGCAFTAGENEVMRFESGADYVVITGCWIVGGEEPPVYFTDSR